jgi:hypothetical protein
MKKYYGVVESRQDPKQLGRLRVRILGIHPEDKVLLPTSDLPWATVLSHDGSNSGLGTTPSFFVEGTWVLVDFFDTDRQEPYVIGGIPGVPAALGNPDVGFNDPNRRSTDSSSDDYKLSVYPAAVNTSDIHENARGSLTAVSPVARDSIRKTAVPSADFDSTTVSTVDGSLTVSASDGSTFDEPLVVDGGTSDTVGTYKPTYTKNHVYSTEKGHLLEFDDTEGYQRIAITHSAGSYQEYSNDGTYVSHIVSKMFEVVSSDKSSLIEGDVVETIDKGLKLKVNKLGASGNNYDIEVGEGANLNIMVRTGDVNLNVTGNVNVKSSGDTNIDCDNFRVAASGAIKMTSGTGKNIDLN